MYGKSSSVKAIGGKRKGEKNRKMGEVAAFT